MTDSVTDVTDLLRKASAAQEGEKNGVVLVKHRRRKGETTALFHASPSLLIVAIVAINGSNCLDW